MKLSHRRMGRPSLGGILATRQGALILAILCAVCAAGVLMFALSSYKQGVKTAAVPMQATVLVAAGEIQKGTAGNQVVAGKLYKSTPVVASQLAPGAISDAAQLHGAVAQSDILPGQQLTTTDFSHNAGVSALLGPTQRAIAVPTDEVHGALDVLSPGDRVDLYATLQVSIGPRTVPEVAFIASDVLVLKTPGTGLLGSPVVTAKPSTSGPVQSALVFALSSLTVPLLELSADSGKIWITVRPANATPPPGGITALQTIVSQAGAAPTVSPYPSPATAPNPNNATSTATTTGKH